MIGERWWERGGGGSTETLSPPFNLSRPPGVTIVQADWSCLTPLLPPRPSSHPRKDQSHVTVVKRTQQPSSHRRYRPNSSQPRDWNDKALSLFLIKSEQNVWKNRKHRRTFGENDFCLPLDKGKEERDIGQTCTISCDSGSTDLDSYWNPTLSPYPGLKFPHQNRKSALKPFPSFWNLNLKTKNCLGMRIRTWNWKPEKPLENLHLKA